MDKFRDDAEFKRNYFREWYRKNKNKYGSRFDYLSKRKVVDKYNSEYEYKKELHLLRKYGITLKEYNAMFDAQNGCCAICGKHQSECKRGLHVDHNHETGQVRGLLCPNCNRKVGDVENGYLYGVLEYLEDYDNR